MQKPIIPLILLCFTLLFAGPIRAQIPVQIGTGTLSPASTLYGPVYRFSSTSTTNGARVNMLWTAAEMSAAGIPTGSLITGVEFNKTNNANFSSTVPFKMLVANTSNTTLNTTDTWANVLNTHTQVINNSAFNLPATVGWVTFTFNAPFTYTGGAFEVATEHDITALTQPRSTDAIKWEYTSGHNTKIAGVATPTGATLNGTVTGYKERPNIKILYIPATPCTAPPTPGTATASVSTTCPNVDFNLSVSGNSFGLGQTYQWESSATGSAPWSPVGASSNGTGLTTSQTSTKYYRLAATCSGQTAYSNSVQVVTNATPLAGTYTIDKNASASATNFTSFASLVNELNCRGISAPVIVNVATGSGPYNERVALEEINGASATNTITFNGNGNKISFASTAANRSVVELNGTDFVTFQNFQIDAIDATYGWGFHLLNGANNNTISNNTITLASTSTTEANSGGVIFSNSTTAVTTAGNTGINNIISGNTITGGYKGIHLNSEITTASNNQLINNIIRDFYADGIKVNAAKGTLVEGNNISRPTRTAITTFTGIELSGNSQLTTVSKNRIHNPAGAIASSTSASYGFYSTAADAPVGSENVFRNNLIYNINTNGIVYGIYNSSSDGSFYYHNTIDLNNTSNTGTVRGLYQTGAASNIKLINNIISINSGATGTKHAIYVGTTTSSITSNNNVLYIAPTLTNGHIGYFSGNKTTLADWKTANSNAYDQASISVNPLYVSAATGNLRPNTVALNNIGQPLAAVTTDINGNTRSTTTPDPGAYEFDVPANDVAVTNISGPVSGCGLTANVPVTITLRNFGSATQTSIPVTYSVNGTQVGSGTWTGTLAPNASATFLFTQTANLAASGAYVIAAEANLATDTNPTNDTLSVTIGNALLPSLPIAFDFETPATSVGAMKVVTNSNSNVTENAAASNGPASTKGMLMEGVSSTQWNTPAGIIDPWSVNPAHFSAATLCFNPNTVAPQDTLFLTFDLKQLYKDSHLNTNFRVTVNGQQIGTTYNPPFGGYGTASAPWNTIRINLNAYKQSGSIQIGLESSVKEEFANGAGTANLIDNIRIFTVAGPTGVKENFLQNSVAVFPNPSTGLFNLKVPATTRSYSVEVTDLTGKVMKQQVVKNNSGTEQLNLSGTAKGIYILKIASEGKVATRKLIVE